MRALMLLLVLLVSGIYLMSQEVGDMVTDRPDRTESARTLPTGVLQIETGFHYEGDRELGYKVNFYNLNGTLFRLGVTEVLELRLVTAYSKLTVQGESVDGLAPFTFGFKSQIATSDGRRPDFAIIGGITPANSGSRYFSSDKWGFDILGALAWELPKNLSLGANLGLATPDGFSSVTVPVSVSLGFPFDYKFGGFAELASDFTEGDDPHLSLGTGVTYAWNADLQLDAYLGKGVNDAANDWYFGFGLSWRIGPLFY